MDIKQKIFDLYRKRYKDELTSQKIRNQIEIDKLLSTTNVVSFKILGRYKKTKVVKNNKNLKQVKKSEAYLNRIKKKSELQLQIENVHEINFENKFDQDIQKFKEIFIDELEEQLEESEKWLKNKENALNLSISNQLAKSIIDKNKKDVEELTENIDNFKNKLQNIDSDEMYLEIISYTYDILSYDYKVKKQELDTERKKALKSANKKKQIDEVYKKDSKIKRTEKYIKKDINRSHKHFLRSIGSLPYNLKKNLKNMPNNKGYIWKNIHFYGKLPAENNNLIMFEKKRNGNLLIHEYIKNWYTLKEKRGRTVRVIKKPVYRKSKVQNNSFFNNNKVKNVDFKKKKLEPIVFRQVNTPVNNFWNVANNHAIKQEGDFKLSQSVIDTKKDILKDEIILENSNGEYSDYDFENDDDIFYSDDEY